MAVIETKYSIGDIVYHAGTLTKAEQFPCPDCLGSKKWLATSPAGKEYPVPCPRCSANYQSRDALNLKYTVHAPHVRRLTIGQVRASAGRSTWGEDRGHEYMCVETGIGSGSLYYEPDLFQTEEEALSVATAKAALGNLDRSSHIGQLYDKRAEFCDYQLEAAAIEAAERRARTIAYRADFLVEDLKDARSLGEVRERIERWQEDPDARPPVTPASTQDGQGPVDHPPGGQSGPGMNPNPIPTPEV